MLSRDEILSKKDLRREKINVPEWGGDVFVIEMNGITRDAFEQTLIIRDSKKRLQNYRAKLVCFTVVDESGQRIFDDADTEAIGNLSGAALSKVCALAQELNGLTEKELKEAEKN